MDSRERAGKEAAPGSQKSAVVGGESTSTHRNSLDKVEKMAF